MENKVVYDTAMNTANEAMNFASKVLTALIRMFSDAAQDDDERALVEDFLEYKGQFLTFPATDEFMKKADNEGLSCIRFQCEDKEYVLFKEDDKELAQKIANECKYSDRDTEISPSSFVDAANSEPLIVASGFQSTDEINQFRSKTLDLPKNEQFDYTAVHYGDEFAVIAYKKDEMKLSKLIDKEKIHDLSDKDYDNLCMQDLNTKIEKAGIHIKQTEQTKTKEKTGPER